MGIRIDHTYTTGAIREEAIIRDHYEPKILRMRLGQTSN